MKLNTVLTIVSLICASMIGQASFADYHYDTRTGNSYTTYTVGNTTYVNGRNSRTGATWNTTINPNGNSYGRDASGNSWNYNSNTGSYTNSNGHFCTGKGAYRVCN